MEISQALSYHGSVADSKLFGPIEKDPQMAQFRTYIQENNTHALNEHLLSKNEMLAFLISIAANYDNGSLQ